MPRYFFNVRENGVLELDPDGQELPNKEAAANEARFFASEMLRDAAIHGHELRQTIEVVEGDKLVLRYACGDIQEIADYAAATAPPACSNRRRLIERQ